jgi:Tfp pilus assembly protein PilN
MHAVNLLPKQVVVAPGRNLTPLALAGAAAVPVIAIVLVVIGYSSASSGVSSEKAKFAALQAQIAALGGASAATPKTASATDAATLAQWNALIGQRTARRTELDSVLSQSLPWDSMLRNVARILPDDVWLTALSFQSPVTLGTAAATPAPAAGTPASNFTISGYGQSEKSIALLLVRLRLLPILSNVTLGPTTNSTIGPKAVVQFSVTAAIQGPAAPAVLPTTSSPVPAATTTTTPAA